VSHTTINDVAVLEATIGMPRVGLWVADLVTMDEGPEIVGQVTIQVGAKLSLVGTVVRGGAYQGRRTVRVVAGAGGLHTDVAGRWYQGVPLSIAVGDAISEAGETLSTTSDQALLGAVSTPGWCRTKGAAADALGRLVADAGAVWRALPDGTIWVGTETWPEAPAMPDVLLFEDRKSTGRVAIATEAPTVLPGASFQGQHISYVEIAVQEDKIRVELFVEYDGAATDRFKRGLVAVIGAVVDKKIDALAMYPAKVVQQNADGQLECVTEDDRIGSIGPLPIRLGLPGAKVKIKSGARVLLGFENGDTRAPYAALWDTAELDELELLADTSFKVTAGQVELTPGGLPAARQGDMVGIGGGIPAAPNCTIALFSGGPIVAGALMPAYIGAGPPLPPVMPLYGLITSGNPGVKT